MLLKFSFKTFQRVISLSVMVNMIHNIVFYTQFLGFSYECKVKANSYVKYKVIEQDMKNLIFTNFISKCKILVSHYMVTVI